LSRFNLHTTLLDTKQPATHQRISTTAPSPTIADVIRPSQRPIQTDAALRKRMKSYGKISPAPSNARRTTIIYDAELGNQRSEKKFGSASIRYPAKRKFLMRNSHQNSVGPLEVRKVLSLIVVDLRYEKRKWYQHVHVQDLKSTSANQDNSEGRAERNDIDI